jgi:hypothetical protein
VTGDSQFVGPLLPLKLGAGRAKSPIINSWPVCIPSGAHAAFDLRKRPPREVVCLGPPSKRQCSQQDGPTSTTWVTAPQDGPILLSDSQVSNLGTYIDRDVQLLEQLGWEKFVQVRRGASDLSTTVDKIRHPARSTLRNLRRRGARAPMAMAPWSDDQLAATIARGPHKSAFEHIQFLGEELAEFVLKGQWVVLPYSVVRSLPSHIQRQLRISPVGVVPQRERRPRVIVDYSFFGVNAGTAKLAPREAMQFGKALERILCSIVEADPVHGPVFLLKIDIADGFYRIWLNENDILSLAVSLPPLHGDTLLVALPLVLPMGWTESPPYFTAATETVADLANQRLLNRWQPPPHRLEQLADTPTTSALPSSNQHNSATAAPLPDDIPVRRHRSKPLANVDVFVDDFIGVCQGPIPRRRTVRRIMLHTLDDIFRPLGPQDNPHRKEPVSEKKLRQGDGSWETRKLVLGWILDTIAMTIELPEHRRLRLRILLDSIWPSQKRISVRKWQQILGELRSMAIAIPGSTGLFSWMQETLKHRSDNRIRLTRTIHDCISDFQVLSHSLTKRPTRLFEIIPQDIPDILGASDACGYGIGGVAFAAPYARTREWIHCDGGPSSGMHRPPLVQGTPLPVVWRYALPSEITAQLITFDNPHGLLTNSDLELLATIVHKDILAHAFDVRERTLATGTDNTPALSWQNRGAVSTTGPAAYLLRLQALHQRFHRYCGEHFFIPGVLNSMADDASRLTHLPSLLVLSHFNSTYPQKQPWHLLTPRPEMISSVISALRSSRADTELFLCAPMQMTTRGASGPSSAMTWLSTPPSPPVLPIPFTSSLSLLIATAPELLHPVVNPSNLAQWKVPSVRWGRRWPAWGPRIHG